MSKGPSNLGARRFVSNVAILLVSLLICLVVGEGLARLGAPTDLCCQYDAMLGWSKKPNSITRNITSEFNVTEKFNSKGLRGPEYSYDKAADEYRILILGDSFTEGRSVEFQELFSEILKRKLNVRGDRHYEVINSGTRGYSTVQELLFFQNEGKKYQPDLTILMFHDNDLLDNTLQTVKGRLRPFYRLVNDKPILLNLPVTPPNSRQEQTLYENRRENDHMAIKQAKDWLEANSHLYIYVRSKIASVGYLYRLAIRWGLATSPLNNPLIWFWRKTYNPAIRDVWKIAELVLVNLINEVDSIGSKFLLFYIPHPSAISEDVWETTKNKYGISDEEWDPARVGVEMDAICMRKNLACINSVKLFKAKERELQKRGKRLYFLQDMHWTADGHEYVGEILAGYITSNFLMSDSNPTRGAKD